MKKKRTSTSFNWAISFIIFIPLVISLILSWVAYMRIHDFESNQKDIAHSTIERAGEDISNIIDENRRLVRLFASDEHAMIARLASNTDNLKLREQLQKKIKRFFPHSFAFTIADSHGNPLLDDFDGYIGDICIEDMRNMISTRKYAVRIHPNPYVYHYDELMLLIKNQNYLIEITENGARNTVIRENYHLTHNERARILDMVPVKHSMWHLTDLAEPGLFNQFRMRTYRTFGMIIVAFILIAVTFSIVLVHFERKRQQAESMRDEMLSLFSHDLRSPLIGIKGAMELLKEHSATIAQDKREHLYRLIHEYVMHMGRIVDDILDVYKLESGKMSFHFEKIPLSNLIKQAIAMVTGYAEQFNVQLEVNNDTDDTLLVRVDQQRLIRCLTNLLTNALKFSPVGGTVVIRTSYKHGKAIIAIQDHGPGIPQSLQPHIFQKFVQSRKLQVHNLPSTGLGLTIVKYIAEAHGGRVYFETSPGNGTCFYLELPVVNNSDTSLTG
ncbi:MAG: HAMP domain-containing sensor histidine kinase [Gammaproteobacteria bacterium]